MTMSIPVRSLSNVLAYHQEIVDSDGVPKKGYILQVQGSMPVFMTEKEADKLGRYLLFNEDRQNGS